MTHLLIDALSVNNLSGRHVLLGHLRELDATLGQQWRLSLLVHTGNRDLAPEVPSRVTIHELPIGPGWLGRQWWLRRRGANWCRQHGVDAVLSPSGMLSGGLPVPQLVLAQNPLPLMSGMASGLDRFKAWLQRREFARAQRLARVMVFNSRYMQSLYERSCGRRVGPNLIAYQGIDDSLFALPAPKSWAERHATVLSVSVMARHKAVEVLVDAFAMVARRLPDAELVLVGQWPEPTYRKEVERQIERLGLEARVRITGHVSTEELHRLYADSRAFCLLSRCESFGIPAVEAQAFATPTVVAEGTAAPEVTGGHTVPPDDSTATASALEGLLTDPARWKTASRQAQKNVQRFRWHECSAPLVAAVQGMFES